MKKIENIHKESFYLCDGNTDTRVSQIRDLFTNTLDEIEKRECVITVTIDKYAWKQSKEEPKA